MWENIIIWVIIGTAVVFLGIRLLRQWRAAVTPGKNISCCSGCSGCTSACDTQHHSIPRN